MASYDTFSHFLEATNQLKLRTDISITNNTDIDPDLNTFNLVDNISKYYMPDEFQTVIKKTSFKNKFSVLHINARSLINKIANLEIFLESLNFSFDIIAISETWENITNEQFLNLAGFTKVSKMRSDGRTGGGVALFIKDTIPFKIRNDISTNFCESVSIEVPGSKKTKLSLLLFTGLPILTFKFSIRSLKRFYKLSLKKILNVS